MTLKIVKGGISSEISDKGLFIIEATNNKGEVGYISEVNNKISVSQKLIPQVVRYTSYKDAKRQINHIESNIQGLKLKILGQKKIEEILSNQENLDVVVPVGEVKEVYIVCICDSNTNDKLGYMAYDPLTKQYTMKADKSAIAFFESKEHVEQFISEAKALIKNPNLTLKPEKLDNNG